MVTGVQTCALPISAYVKPYVKRQKNDAADAEAICEAVTCPFRKLNPTVLMVKSAQDVASDDATAALNKSAIWSIFLQAEMGPCRVVIRSVFLQDALKMGLAPHNHVVKTLTSDRADCALDISILPRRSRRDRAVANAYRPNTPREHRAINAVIVRI